MEMKGGNEERGQVEEMLRRQDLNILWLNEC